MPLYARLWLWPRPPQRCRTFSGALFCGAQRSACLHLRRDRCHPEARSMSLMHVPAFAQLEHLVSRETFDPRDGSAQICPHQSSRQHQESQDDGHQQATAWVRAAMKLMGMVDVKGSHLTMKSDVFVAAAAGTPNRAKHARWSYLVYAPLRLSLRRQVHQRAPAERRGEGAGEDESGNSRSGNDCVFAHVGNVS